MKSCVYRWQCSQCGATQTCGWWRPLLFSPWSPTLHDPSCLVALIESDSFTCAAEPRPHPRVSSSSFIKIKPCANGSTSEHRSKETSSVSYQNWADNPLVASSLQPRWLHTGFPRTREALECVRIQPHWDSAKPSVGCFLWPCDNLPALPPCGWRLPVEQILKISYWCIFKKCCCLFWGFFALKKLSALHKWAPVELMVRPQWVRPGFWCAGHCLGLHKEAQMAREETCVATFWRNQWISVGQTCFCKTIQTPFCPTP